MAPPFGLPLGFPLLPFLNAISQPLLLIDIYNQLTFDSGSGICIDRQHLELGQVRHVDRKAV